MRLPSKASALGPSSSAKPRTEYKKNIASGKPKTNSEKDIEIVMPIVPQVKYIIPVTKEISM